MKLFKHLFKHAKVYPIVFVNPEEVFLNDECGICLEELDNFSALPCGHCFHSKCISQWISKNMSCPECRIQLRFKKS
jgi:hypothetical protein